MSLSNLWGHLQVINTHKLYVMKFCFRVGLYRQGLLHDLSKYSFVELRTGMKYFDGFVSPNSIERNTYGYSLAWLHHKGRNKHHWEYWVDFTKDGPAPAEMPINYVIEMFLDRVAANMVYKKRNYVQSDPLHYYSRTKYYCIFHEETEKILVELLEYLAENGFDRTIEHINRKYLL